MKKSYLIEKLQLAIKNLELIDCMDKSKTLNQRTIDQKRIQEAYDILYNLQAEIKNYKKK